MIKPLIHLGGTGGETLAEGYRNALTAVRSAIESMSHIEFHSRDYYPLPSGHAAWDVAVSEQRDRVLKLKSVEHDLEELMTYCYDAIEAKAKRRAGQ